MANKSVLAAVKEGKQALAKYRAANASVLLDLTEADLRDADLRGMNLRRVLLVGAKLARADLTGALLMFLLGGQPSVTPQVSVTGSSAAFGFSGVFQ